MRDAKYWHEATPLVVDGSIELVPDDELERLANDAGPKSTAAAMLRVLKHSRAKDRQVFAFHVKEYFFVGPVPDAKTEAELLSLAELIDVAS
jgi:hypothetical protein